MGKISLTTNVDLQNYEKRIDDIVRYMNPLGIEIFSLPQNYANRYQLELPDRQDSDRFALLSKELAKGIGRKFKKHGIHRVQYHYPWQKTLLDMDGHNLALTIQFGDIILEESGVDQLTINYHNVLKYPTPSMVKGFDGSYREDIHGMLETQTVLVRQIRDQFKSPCLLIVENNPAVSIDYDKKTGEGILDNVDLVAEDYIGRRGIDGTNLDYSHAWTVVEYFKGDKKYSNLEWCRRQYGGVPESAKSMENFVREVAPKVRWLHLSDEPHPYTHSSSHIGDGEIDFRECARLLDEYLTNNDIVVATIEVKDGHTPEGFKKIIEHDFPCLSKIF